MVPAKLGYPAPVRPALAGAIAERESEPWG
jgi:hypothetical protein